MSPVQRGACRAKRAKGMSAVRVDGLLLGDEQSKYTGQGPLSHVDRICRCSNRMPCGHWGEADGLHKPMNDHCAICGKYYKLPAVGVVRQNEPKIKI